MYLEPPLTSFHFVGARCGTDNTAGPAEPGSRHAGAGRQSHRHAHHCADPSGPPATTATTATDLGAATASPNLYPATTSTADLTTGN